MDHGQLYFSVIPSLDGIAAVQLLGGEALKYPLQIMLVPVGNENRFAIGSFDYILKSIQLAIVDFGY